MVLLALAFAAALALPAAALAEGGDGGNPASLTTGMLTGNPTREGSVASGTCGDGLTWELTGEGDDLTLTISGTGAMTNYQFESAPWEEDYRDSVKTLTIGNGVTSIGNCAFYECKSLESVTIPDSVTTIGSFAFYDCISLGSVTIPDSVTSIGDYAFYSTDLKSIKLDSVSQLTSIGEKAFSICFNLESVDIPDGVTEIGSFAFDGCSKLKSVTIPASVTSIGVGAFATCSSMESISVASENQKYKSVSGILYEYDKDKTTLIQYPCGLKNESVTIPASVTSIGDYAFSETELESVTIPASVTSIGQSAFAQCDALTEITIPASVTSIGSDAFYSCNMLERVSIESGVTSIGESAFKSIALNATITIDTYETKVSKGDNWSGGAAVFWTKVKVATTANPENGGKVTITGGEQVEGGCVFKKSDSGVALLTAVPSEGHCFTSWTENGKVVVDGDGNPVGTTYTFAITNDTVDRNLKANFGPYSVTVVNGKADPETAKMGDKVTVTADEPKSGKAFSGWTVKGLEDESLGDPKKSKASFEMPGNNVTVTANYCDVLINETGSDSGIGERDYIGGPIKPTLEVSLKGVDITFGADDYTATFTNNVDIGMAKVKVTLNDPYVGSGEAQFKINPASFSDATVKVAAENRVYDGTELKPVPTVTWHDMKVAEKDYAAKYTDNVRAGTATVKVTGEHNFKDDYTKTATFQIKTRPLTITAGSAKRVYDGTALTSDGFTSEGLAEGDRVASAEVKGEQTEAGSSSNEVSDAKVVNAAGEDVTGCYDITYAPGTLTVTAAPATIEVGSASKVEGEADPGAVACKVGGLVVAGDLGEVSYRRTNADEAPGLYRGVLDAAYTPNKNYDVTVAKGDFTIKRRLTAVWLDGDGGVLVSKYYGEGDPVPAYGGKKPTKAATAQYAYRFAGWDGGTSEGATTTYRPLFSKTVNEYEVRFVDHEGKVLQSSEVAYGQTPKYTGKTPTKAADARYTYTFAGWEPKVAKVTGKVTYRAAYSRAARLGRPKVSSVVFLGRASASVRWTAAANARSYEVQWRAVGGKWSGASVRGASMDVRGLKAGGLYQFRARAAAGSVKGAWSNTSARWWRTVALRSAKRAGAGAVSVSWRADAQADAGYAVVVRDRFGGEVVARRVVAAGVTSATVRGLEAGKRVWVRVRPLRSAGGSTYVGVLSAGRYVRV